MSLRLRQAGYLQLESDGAIVSRLAQQDKTPWYKKRSLRRLYLFMVLACYTVEMSFGFDLSMVNGLQAVPSWLEYFHNPHSVLLGFIIAVYSLGCVCAVPFAPLVIDHMGRRYSIWLGGIIGIVGAIMQGFALNTIMFIIARFVLGFSVLFGVVAASSLIGELTHPNDRVAMGFLFGNFYYFGAITAAGLVLGTHSMKSDWGWRIPSLLQAAPSLLQSIFIWLLPESPRWLVSRGMTKEAYAILVNYHAEGDENATFVQAEYTQIEQTLEAERKVTNVSWKDVFSTPGMRKRATIAIFLGLAVQWSGVGLTAYLLSPILDSIGIHDNRTKNIINLARMFWGLVNSTMCALLALRFSRRSIFLTSTIFIFLIFTAWTIASAHYSLTHSQISAQIVLILIFMYNPAYNLGFTTAIHTFLVELFPFHMRARGIAIYQWSCRLSGFVSQLVDPIGIGAVGWKWFTVYCVWDAFQVAFVYLMFPETSGRTLEELAFLYEGDQEPFRQSEADALHGHDASENSYGTTQGNTISPARHRRTLYSGSDILTECNNN